MATASEETIGRPCEAVYMARGFIPIPQGVLDAGLAAADGPGRPLLELARRTGLRQHLHGMNAANADQLLKDFVAALIADLGPAVARMSWLAAQAGDLKIQRFVLLGGQDLVEIVDEAEEVIGRGETLEAALDDAMGVTRPQLAGQPQAQAQGAAA